MLSLSERREGKTYKLKDQSVEQRTIKGRANLVQLENCKVSKFCEQISRKGSEHNTFGNKIIVDKLSLSE